MNMTSSKNFFDGLGEFVSNFRLEDMIINPSNKGIRKVTESNKFPCFHCGGDQILASDCTRCDKKGYLSGSHPMVKMIERIIDSKFRNRQQNIQVASLQNALGAELSSSMENIKIHDDYKCDECGTAPIKGKRYHCPICKNYDTCQQCSKKTQHEHQLEEGTQQQPQQPSAIAAINKQTQKSLLFKTTYESMTTSRLSK